MAKKKAAATSRVGVPVAKASAKKTTGIVWQEGTFLRWRKDQSMGFIDAMPDPLAFSPSVVEPQSDLHRFLHDVPVEYVKSTSDVEPTKVRLA